MPMITPALRRAQATASASASASASTSAPGLAAATASTATLASQTLPPLAAIAHDAATLARVTEPVKRITSEHDVEAWKRSRAYAIYTLFVQRLSEACVGKPTRLAPPPRPSAAAEATAPKGPKDRLVAMLYELDGWTSEITPHAKPQRFGNLAFRDWGARLAQRIDQLHAALLPAHLVAFVPELSAYLLEAFGSFTRIDYGSGHELAFAIWLCTLYRLGFFAETDDEVSEVADVEVDEVLALEIFPLYLLVVWRLQDRYGLEPAGSHGVWGLDDFHFLPYVFGAAQLRNQSALRPSQIVAASSHPRILDEQLGEARDPASLISTALEVPGSLLVGEGAEGGGVVVPNLYLSSLLRIAVLKRGPFHEHSPLLHDIASTVPNWIKLHAGMLKMYAAECLSKKVVVQHVPFGNVALVWEPSTQLATSLPTPMPARTHAIGGLHGNLGSLGIPTTRHLPTTSTQGPTSPAAARLGHALRLPPPRAPPATAPSAASTTLSTSDPRHDQPPPS